VPAFSPIIILDAGPLAAAVDRLDAHHLWATTEMLSRSGPFIVTSAAVAEATHLFRNQGPALERLRALVERMQVEDPAPVGVLELMERYTPAMDYADACAVLLARRHKGAVVLTTDHRDFSVYRVPFVSPKGEFHG
jgi:predicted nucleic acid-binding protein